MTREIELTQGKVAFVDDEDYEELSKYSWSVRKGHTTCYAQRADKHPDGRHKIVLMHRQIMNAGAEVEVDHRNHNGLDNTRANLRIATRAENQHNRKSERNSTSRFKGVHWHSGHRRWFARITIGGKVKHIGSFVDEEEAARAFDSVALKLHGEFAYLNFPAAEAQP